MLLSIKCKPDFFMTLLDLVIKFTMLLQYRDQVIAAATVREPEPES